MKKQQGAINLFQAQQATNAFNVGSGSDSDPSPSFTSPEYLNMMQQWAPEQQMGNGMGLHQGQTYQEQGAMHGLPLNVSVDTFASNYPMGQHLGDDTFNSQEDMNRRTMTQEQFDAMARDGGMMNGSSDFGNFQFSGDSGIWNTVLPEMQGNDIKQQDAFAFPHAFGAPMSSYDSTVPSTISEQSMPMFPSSNQMQNRVNLSATSSEWSGSRSSSICASHPGESMIQAAQRQSTSSTAQWQPGQSVPVDVNALNEEFRQAAQARDRQQVHSQAQEQPLAWPDDDAFARRDSQANMLVQGLSNVGINTPQPSQSATFKSPAPPANIAARRQRRPAPIGLAAMRSQSYSGVVPPATSPGHVQPQNLAPGQQLRRIRSSNMINGAGGVAHGRVVKSGSAQRSPLSWTFADAMNSPRHVSGQGSLAPPTPMTPNEYSGQEPGSQFPSWNASSGQATRHPSINETDLEHELPYQPSASVPPARNFSSPPHTPSYYQQQFMQQRVGNNVIMEDTPPQSAPASQLCFPSASYSQPQPQQQQQPAHHQQSHSQPYAQGPMVMPASQAQQNVSSSAPSQSSNLHTVTFAPTQHAPVTSGPPPGVPLQFANGIPMVDEEGNITMAFPQPMQFLPDQGQPQQVQQMHTPPQQPYPFMNSASASPNAQVTAQLPKQTQPAQEFFVHEYSPPEELKRSATPRKTVDSGPKNYTFANSGPEHWEKQARKAEAKAASATASNSPAGSNTSAS